MENLFSKMDITTTCFSAKEMERDDSNAAHRGINPLGNCCAPQEAVNLMIAPPLPVIYGVLPNFSRQDINALAPLKGPPKGDIVRHASQSTTQDRPQPKCRKILFGLDETTRMHHKEKIQKRVASTTSMASSNKEIKSTEEDELQSCMSMAEMPTRPQICLPHIPERCMCIQYYDGVDFFLNSGDDYCANRNINFDEEWNNLFPNAEQTKIDAANNVSIVLNKEIQIGSITDISSCPVNNIVDAGVDTVADEEDSEAQSSDSSSQRSQFLSSTQPSRRIQRMRRLHQFIKMNKITGSSKHRNYLSN